MEFSYSISRKYNFNIYQTILFFAVAALYAVIITLIALAAQGYETVAVYGDGIFFNGTNRLWYDGFIPSAYRSRHRNYSAATINLGDCTLPCALR